MFHVFTFRPPFFNENSQLKATYNSQKKTITITLLFLALKKVFPQNLSRIKFPIRLIAKIFKDLQIFSENAVFQ